jgi:acid phosphatase (class A)
MRRRPYDRFNEPTLVPAEEERLRTNGSYPSGHTVRAWSMALLLIEVNPSAQDALLKYAYEWGQSRVIAGFHWQSDVDASKVLVSGAYPSLHTNDVFMADMRKAQAEFKKLSAAKNGKKVK